jgi:very-short-patch-repair endonuclease
MARGVNHARRLRQSAPATERKLWAMLRDRRLSGLKFRRQVPIGPYIADFVCLRHRLIIEADGPFHDPVRDEARDGWLSAQGFRVLRFSNREADQPGRVIEAIVRATSAAPAAGLGATPHPSAVG